MIRMILVSLVLFWARASSADTVGNLGKLIDSRDTMPLVLPAPGHSLYAYGPSITYLNGTFHMFYCSTNTDLHPDGIPVGWDVVRYATSPDGRLWTAPRVILRVSDYEGERAACDPSVVKLGNYFYLFYSGNRLNVQTLMFVARSSTIDGTYQKWNGVGWVENATAPTAIIGPNIPALEACTACVPALDKKGRPIMVDRPAVYGAGQQSVVNRNGVLYSWYFDDNGGSQISPPNTAYAYFTTSTDAVHWSTKIATNLSGKSGNSFDVKWDASSNRFVLFDIDGLNNLQTGDSEGDHGETTFLVRRYSSDGITWSSPEVIADSAHFPDYAHNIGISGDQFGNLIGNTTLAVYGIPYDRFSPDFDFTSCRANGSDATCWAHWDLGATVINPSGPTWNDIPWGWQGNGNTATANAPIGNSSDYVPVVGDFDGDNKSDPTVFNKVAGLWYVRSSRTATQGVPGIPWPSWTPLMAGAELACADYDGDGTTDRAAVVRSSSIDNKWYVMSSITGLPGVPGIPWGWPWSGMRSSHKIVVGNYDSDGKADRAIFDPVTGAWFVVASVNGAAGTATIPWGQPISTLNWNPSMQVYLGDFDGDSKTDRAIVSSIGRWYVTGNNGSAGVPGISYGWQWGGWTSGLTPALGDYDGDHKTDRAMTNLTTDPAAWYVISSIFGTAGFSAIPWGWTWFGMTSQFDIVPGDYDGDGKTDRAIFNRSTGRWYVIGSAPFVIY